MRANYAFIDPSLAYDDTRVFLTLALKEDGADPAPGPELTQLQALARLYQANANQGELVGILDSLETSDPRYPEFFNTFVGLSDDQVTEVLEEMSGSRGAGAMALSIPVASGLMDFVNVADGFGGFMGIGGQAAALMSSGTQQFASTSGMSQHGWDSLAKSAATIGVSGGPASWVRVVEQTGRQGSSSGMPGSDTRSSGLQAGVEMPFTDAISAGVALGYQEGRITSGDLTRIDNEVDSGVVYGRYRIEDVRLSGALGYSHIDNDSSRRIPQFAHQTAEYGADVWMADAQVARDWQTGVERLTLSPFVGLRYAALDQDSYVEEGPAGRVTWPTWVWE
ncbi:outer membrane autotransporter barrel domain-containing protein [Franzmannia pantelleriensis]|uniref:Outer membrane autotransporter barrel domain-containing protein n=1 Tax=Franzmannia pantelleriensis TaxID=48727 RepID=A0A1G9EFK3_9GAMM|nr:autotransporter outer membrane beta-barrel domain-containing protein [Halomonas pantelleriensis]SDK74843.1 outer membrane autotransporter barrel domain-containing protein [Halomonas pantelleriensis]